MADFTLADGAIQVSFVGNHPTTWTGSSTDSTETRVDKYAQAREYLRRHYGSPLVDEMLSDDDAISRTQERAAAAGLVVLANDPLSILGAFPFVSEGLPHDHIKTMAQYLHRLFECGKPADDGGAIDGHIESQVRGWYSGRCLLARYCSRRTRVTHIISQRAVESGHAHLTRRLLPSLWDLPELEGDQVPRDERVNLLPMMPTPRKSWDDNLFALRPIWHPDDPQHRLYLQVVSLTTEPPPVSDLRRDSGGGWASTAVDNGDVYELVTPDAAARPLPSVDLLEIRFILQKMLAGLTTTETLRFIFREQVPLDCGPAFDAQKEVPVLWQVLVKEAQAKDVLTGEAARLWMRAFALKHMVRRLVHEEVQRILHSKEVQRRLHKEVQRRLGSDEQ